MTEMRRVPPGTFAALHYNVQANLVAWLHLSGRPVDATHLLDLAFAETPHPS